MLTYLRTIARLHRLVAQLAISSPCAFLNIERYSIREALHMYKLVVTTIFVGSSAFLTGSSMLLLWQDWTLGSAFFVLATGITIPGFVITRDAWRTA